MVAVSSRGTRARPRLNAVSDRLQRHCRDHGFACSDRDGLPTTLAATAATTGVDLRRVARRTEVHIWTDVDGVMSGDPRRVPEEDHRRDVVQRAMELAYFGAQGDPPADGAGNWPRHPVWIRNTFNDASGHQDPHRRRIAPGASRASAASTTSHREPEAHDRVPGTADRLFGAARGRRVGMMISQGSSEHSTRFAVPENAAEHVRRVVERAFAAELAQGPRSASA
jgi:aspartokinase/homoserine dehydrogenase 1